MRKRMMKFLPGYATILCMSMLSLQNAGRAQGLQYPPKQNSLKADASHVGGDILSFAATVGGDILYVFSSPLRLKQKGGVKFLAFTALTTASVVWLDRDLEDDFNEREDFFVKPAIGLAKIGDGYDKFLSNKYMLAGLPVTMLAAGLIFKDKKLILTSRLMVESFIITGKITMIGKGVFGRARPYTGEGPLEFAWLKFNTRQERRSLPSGHVSSAFSIVTVLAKQYDSWWIEIPAYTVGVAVAFQRMESRSHWGADVIVGGALGYWVGSTLVNRYKQPSKSSSVNPYMMGNRVGLLVEF
ncbi:phosphatase PAP2 family protein [candidate division KSB1 bacterium]|nr:phosphatase PAP2 family protein [candidate division KSB1 bacterium]